MPNRRQAASETIEIKRARNAPLCQKCGVKVLQQAEIEQPGIMIHYNALMRVFRQYPFSNENCTPLPASK